MSYNPAIDVIRGEEKYEETPDLEDDEGQFLHQNGEAVCLFEIRQSLGQREKIPIRHRCYPM